MREPMLSTPLDNITVDAFPSTRSPQEEAPEDRPLTREEVDGIRQRAESDNADVDDMDVLVLVDHVDYLTDAYEQLVKRSAEEADRAQALVLRKEEELAAHDDLHRAAAHRIEQLVRQLALTNEALDGSRDVLRRALIALREPMTQTDCRRAREILQTHHNECARAAAKARRESTPFPTAPGASL